MDGWGEEGKSWERLLGGAEGEQFGERCWGREKHWGEKRWEKQWKGGGRETSDGGERGELEMGKGVNGLTGWGGRYAVLFDFLDQFKSKFKHLTVCLIFYVLFDFFKLSVFSV